MTCISNGRETRTKRIEENYLSSSFRRAPPSAFMSGLSVSEGWPLTMEGQLGIRDKVNKSCIYIVNACACAHQRLQYMHMHSCTKLKQQSPVVGTPIQSIFFRLDFLGMCTFSHLITYADTLDFTCNQHKIFRAQLSYLYYPNVGMKLAADL